MDPFLGKKGFGNKSPFFVTSAYENRSKFQNSAFLYQVLRADMTIKGDYLAKHVFRGADMAKRYVHSAHPIFAMRELYYCC